MARTTDLKGPRRAGVEVDREDLRAWLGDVDRLVALISDGAAQLARDLDHISRRQMTALARLDDRAAGGAREMRRTASQWGESVEEVCAPMADGGYGSAAASAAMRVADCADRARRAVERSSDAQARAISAEISTTLSETRRLEDTRSDIAALVIVAEQARDAVSTLDLALNEGRLGAPGAARRAPRARRQAPQTVEITPLAGALRIVPRRATDAASREGAADGAADPQPRTRSDELF